MGAEQQVSKAKGWSLFAFKAKMGFPPPALPPLSQPIRVQQAAPCQHHKKCRSIYHLLFLNPKHYEVVVASQVFQIYKSSRLPSRPTTTSNCKTCFFTA
uniref:Uncharacterized protein n=1 Tax=Ditylenchus dipsaci TaxID=166011 RepID=A0A915CMC3_9BILA